MERAVDEERARARAGAPEKRDGFGGGVTSSSVSITILRRDVRALRLRVGGVGEHVIARRTEKALRREHRVRVHCGGGR